MLFTLTVCYIATNDISLKESEELLLAAVVQGRDLETLAELAFNR
jgi:hypothetical protein